MDGQVQFRPAEGEGIQREIRMAEINRLKRNKNISSFFLTLSLSPAKSPSLLLISPTDDDNNNQEEEEDNCPFVEIVLGEVTRHDMSPTKEEDNILTTFPEVL